MCENDIINIMEHFSEKHENLKFKNFLDIFNTIRFYNQNDSGSIFEGFVFSLPKERNLEDKISNIEEKINAYEKIKNNLDSLRAVGYEIVEHNFDESGVPEQISINLVDVPKFIDFVKTLESEDVFKSNFSIESTHEGINKEIRSTVVSSKDIDENYINNSIIDLHSLIKEFERLGYTKNVKESEEYIACLQDSDPKQSFIAYEIAKNANLLISSEEWRELAKPTYFNTNDGSSTSKVLENAFNISLEALEKIKSSNRLFERSLQNTQARIDYGMEQYSVEGDIRKNYIESNKGWQAKNFEEYLEVLNRVSTNLQQIKKS